jgi:uncharacterized membrane protein
MYSKAIVVNVLVTLFLATFINKSNFSEYLVVPMISSLFVKYTIGDFDVGYQWSASDIYYWILLVVTSITTIWLYKLFTKAN